MEIFSILEKVSDPRRDHLKKYSLESIFYITIFNDLTQPLEE